MTDSPTPTPLQHRVKVFFEPFKPLGQAIHVFVKTTTGKTVSGVLIALIILAIIISLSNNHRYPSRHNRGHYLFTIHHGDRVDNPRARHDSHMQRMDDEIRSLQDRIHRSRQEMYKLFSMSSEAKSILPNRTADPKDIHQTISKLNISNNEKFGYSLTISGGIVNGTLTGDNLSGVIARLQAADITVKDNMFQLDYSLDTMQQVIALLEQK